jgi:hypothetical protein
MFGGYITPNGNNNQTINKGTFLLYKKIGEQYYDFQILEKKQIVDTRTHSATK